jgi:anaerobic magnesium-protoporphyrin IX monomethyl ester cyclase
MYDISLIFPRSPFLINEAVFPPLGILYLASYLQKYGDLNVQCIDFGLPGTNIDDIDSDVVGISFTTPQRNEAYKIQKELKNRGVLTIAGGPHPTHMPNECYEQGFDVVIQGEGEESLLGMMSIIRMKKNRTPNFMHVDDYPFPDRSILPIKDYKYYIDDELATVLMSSRGCPFNCSFCAKISDKCRIQSFERTKEEIEYVHEVLGYNAIMFFDDVFTFKKRRLSKLATYFANSDIKFRCFSRTNLLDVPTCYDLSMLNVYEVGLGVESGSDEILSSNLKGTSRESNTKAVRTLHKFGIRAKAFLIIGLPGETHETVAETISWIEEAKPDDVDVSIFQPLPGSKIFSDPGTWGIEFSYDGADYWYKGTPGDYKCFVKTKGLSSYDIIKYRDEIEERFKPKERLK